MGIAVAKVQCQKCSRSGRDKSKDNFVLYDDGSGYCFSCGYTLRSKEHKEEEPEITFEGGVLLTEKELETFRANSTYTGRGFRGIKDETYRTFSVRHQFNEDGQVTDQYYPCTTNYVLTGFKHRKIPKDFSSPLKLVEDGVGQKCDLFGQVNFKKCSNNKYLLVVGGECFKPDAEILTEKGFVKFENLEKGIKVAQYHESGEITFVVPNFYVEKEYNGKMERLYSRFYDMDVTENHNVVYEDYKGVLQKRKAKEHFPKTNTFILGGKCNGSGIGLKKEQIALLLAVCADSKYDTRVDGRKRAHFGLMKERKIKRLRYLLEACDLEYTSYVNTYADGETYTTFNFDLPPWIENKEIPETWIIDATLTERIFILEEIALWDGSNRKDRNAVDFASKHKQEVEKVAAIATTCGYRARVKARKNSFGIWWRVQYSRDKVRTGTQSLSRETYHYTGKVYCVNVNTGMIITRINGQTAVTGNCDQLSAYQMLADDIKRRNKGHGPVAVVSSLIGEKGAYKQLQAQYEWVNRFERIILCFDNDQAGKEATDLAAKVLPKGKVYIMDMELKDPNEYLMQGKEQQFVSAFYSSTLYTPAGIVSSQNIMKEIQGRALVPKVPLPEFLSTLEEMLCGGLSLKTIVNIAAGTSIGKTTLVNACVKHWIFNSPFLTGVVTIEADVPEYGELLLSEHIGRKLALIKDPQEKHDYLQKPEIVEKARELFTKESGDPRFYMIDDRGDFDSLQKKVEELIIRCGVQLIVIDPLSDVLAGLPPEEQELFMKWQSQMIKRYDVLFVNIIHLRKALAGQKDAGRGADVDESQMFGSSSISKKAHVNIMLSRNKYAEDDIERNTTKVSLAKARGTGKTGKAGEIYYEDKTHKLWNKEEWLKVASS